MQTPSLYHTLCLVHNVIVPMCLNIYYSVVNIKLGLRRVTSDNSISKYLYSAIPTLRGAQVCPPLERNSGVTIAIFCGVGTGRSCRFDGLYDIYEPPYRLLRVTL